MAKWKTSLVTAFAFIPFPVAKLIARVALATQGVGFAGHIEQSGEAALLRRLKASGALGPSPTFVDVGAHIGEYVEIIKSLWPSAKVYAFEPSASHLAVLRPAVAAMTDVRLFPMGLSSKSGERTLRKPEDISGLASLEERDIRHIGFDSQMTERVRTTTLDEITRQENIGVVDFMKVDIEGHELSCFNGAAELIRDRRIRMVQFEYGHAHVASKTSMFDMFECFTPHGYRMGVVRPNGRVHIFPSYDEFLEMNLATNYVAVLPELVEKL